MARRLAHVRPRRRRLDAARRPVARIRVFARPDQRAASRSLVFAHGGAGRRAGALARPQHEPRDERRAGRRAADGTVERTIAFCRPTHGFTEIRRRGQRKLADLRRHAELRHASAPSTALGGVHLSTIRRRRARADLPAGATLADGALRLGARAARAHAVAARRAAAARAGRRASRAPRPSSGREELLDPGKVRDRRSRSFSRPGAVSLRVRHARVGGAGRPSRRARRVSSPSSSRVIPDAVSSTLSREVDRRISRPPPGRGGAAPRSRSASARARRAGPRSAGA